jgi:hypothetical protein
MSNPLLPCKLLLPVGGGHQVGRSQLHEVKNKVEDVRQDTDQNKGRIEQSEDDIRKLVSKFSDFKLLKGVSGRFVEPRENSPVQEDIPCRGTFENLPEDFHLWVAVEIDGFLYFKEPEVDTTIKEGSRDGTWRTRKPVHHGPTGSGRSKPFSLRLYAATEEAHYQIQNWIDSGRFERIPWISNTYPVAHVDGLQLPAPGSSDG